MRVVLLEVLAGGKHSVCFVAYYCMQVVHLRIWHSTHAGANSTDCRFTDCAGAHGLKVGRMNDCILGRCMQAPATDAYRQESISPFSTRVALQTLTWCICWATDCQVCKLLLHSTAAEQQRLSIHRVTSCAHQICTPDYCFYKVSASYKRSRRDGFAILNMWLAVGSCAMQQSVWPQV